MSTDEIVTDGDDSGELNEEEIQEMIVKQSIIHLLRIYPVLSPTMLQSGLGPYVKPAMWRPILEELLDAGVVRAENQTLMTPRGRHNTYQKLMLTPQFIAQQAEGN